MECKVFLGFVAILLPIANCDWTTPNVTFIPSSMSKIYTDEQYELTININNYTEFYSTLRINATVAKQYIISIEPESIQIDLNDTLEHNATFTVDAKFLGFSNITFEMSWFNDSTATTANKSHQYYTSVIRKNSFWMTVFSIFMRIMVGLNYINMGVLLDLKTVKTVLKRPVGPVIGFLCQFICMPLAAFGYGYLLLQEEEQYRMGLFTVGCAPGGSNSNFWTLLFGGDINLSVTMTFISTVASIGMMPFWLFLLGRFVFKGALEIPFSTMIITLITLTTPLLVGILVGRFLPKLAAISRKIIRPMSIVIVIVGVTIGTSTNYYIFLLFTWRVIVAVGCVALTGYIIGAFFAWVARLTGAQIVAVSVETAIQNSGIPVVLLTSSLGQPEADLVMIPVLAQIMITNLPLWFIYLFYRILKRGSRAEHKLETLEEKKDAFKMSVKNADLYTKRDLQL